MVPNENETVGHSRRFGRIGTYTLVLATISDWVPSKSRFGLFLGLFLAGLKNRQEQTKNADTCTCVAVRDSGACEHGCLRAPRPGVLDPEAARNYLPIPSESNLCTQLSILRAANSA